MSFDHVAASCFKKNNDQVMSSSIEFRLSAPPIEHVLLRDKTLKYVKTLYKVDLM